MKIKCPDCGTSYEIKAEALGPEGRSVKCAKCGNRWFVAPAGDEQDADDPGFAAGAAADETDKDEADWAADTDAEEDGAGPAGEEADDGGSEDDGQKPEPAAAKAPRDTDRAAEDPDEDEPASAGAGADIETLAKRPKINVNPNKFRRNQIGAILNWLFRRNYRRIGGIALFGTAITVCALLVLARDSVVKQSPDLASLFQMIGFDVNLRGLEFRNLRIFTEVEDGERVLVVEGSIRNVLEERNTVPAVRLSIRSADLQEVYAWTVEPRTKSLNALDETRFRTILADPPGNASDIQVRFVERGTRQIVLE
jgi:predicted Zn finger-like uncharacterized protein